MQVVCHMIIIFYQVKRNVAKLEHFYGSQRRRVNQHIAGVVSRYTLMDLTEDKICLTEKFIFSKSSEPNYKEADKLAKQKGALQQEDLGTTYEVAKTFNKKNLSNPN